jgi:hypothetical protein
MLNGLQQTLQRQGDQPRSIDVGEMSIKLQRLSVDRMKDIADAGSPAGQAINSNANPAQFPPNVNGGGTV